MVKDQSVDEATRIFDDAVQALVGPRTKRVRTDDGRIVIATAPSIYREMQESTAGQMGSALGGSARSLPPVWVACLDWLNEVERTVREWVGHRTVPEGLTEVTLWTWTPEQVPIVLAWAEKVDRWARTAEQLLDARSRFPVEAPCPECGVERVTVTTDDGTPGTRPALAVSTVGARCDACETWWGRDQLFALAEQIGAAALEGIAS